MAENTETLERVLPDANDEWFRVDHLLTQVTGDGTPYVQFARGMASFPYFQTRPIERIRRYDDIGLLDPSDGEPPAKKQMDALTPRERALVQTFGVFRPMGWQHTIFIVDPQRVSYYRVQGSRDPIPFPGFTVSFDPVEVIRAAFRVLQEHPSADADEIASVQAGTLLLHEEWSSVTHDTYLLPDGTGARVEHEWGGHTLNLPYDVQTIVHMDTSTLQTSIRVHWETCGRLGIVHREGFFSVLARADTSVSRASC